MVIVMKTMPATESIELLNDLQDLSAVGLAEKWNNEWQAIMLRLLFIMK